MRLRRLGIKGGGCRGSDGWRSRRRGNVEEVGVGSDVRHPIAKRPVTSLT